ncbi:MAG TPA: efflux RND transporter periplasmic adaptor subunit [Planctomycetaceae bacterium]|nr:efflux RND transporter periplasmic adaptor subunit [Planctomycetaceae bacterium]
MKPNPSRTRVGFPALVGLAVWLTSSIGCQPARNNATNKSPLTPVKLVTAKEAEIQRTTTQPATVHGYFQSQVRAKVNGYCTQLTVDIGDVVAAGDELAQLAVPELEKQRDVLRARVRLQEARYAASQAGVQLAKAGLASAIARLEQSTSELQRGDAELAAAEAEYARTSDLVSRGSIQQRVLDEVTKKRDSSKAALQALQSAVSSMEAEVQIAQAEVSSANALLDTARAETSVSRGELEEIEVMLDYTTIRAPISGVVTQRDLELGELVETDGFGTPPLLTISQIDVLRVRVAIPEVDAPFIQVGDKLELSLPSFSSESPIQATVSRTANALDVSSRTMLIEADVQNPSGKLLPGMFGSATITLTQGELATMLPARAVRFREDGSAYVYVVDGKNSVQITEVQTGFDNGKQIQIVSGIESGTAVIGTHLKRFTDGQQVTPL